MPGYDRERIARLFDEVVEAHGPTGEQTTECGMTVRQIAGQVALERLELSDADILLDVGTGTGDMAIAAALICRRVIDIDVSRRSLEQARMKAARSSLDNVVFAYGGFEDPCAEVDLTSYAVTKILTVYSLHHLPDELKKQSLTKLAELLSRPGRMAIGDIMFFGDPDEHSEEFDEVAYDAGDTDFPARAEYLTGCLQQIGGGVHVVQIHPLVGVIVADFA
jgi:cyclopropane fatty-acyl-phospholipid synthase-like methyltransferase